MKINLSVNKILEFKFIILFLITLCGFLIRVCYLSDFPNGFSRDEAFLGYNAYSIAQTARDINGNFLPLFLESFLYTPAGYAYTSIPFIKVVGLNVFSIRIASAIFGALTVPLMYFLTYLAMSSKSANAIPKKNANRIAVLSSIMLALTPWHINLSRTASVSTLVVFFIVLGTIFLFVWLKSFQDKALILSYASFFLSLTFYIAPFSFVPFFLLIFFLVFRNQIKRYRKKFIIGFFLIMIPIIFTYINPNLSLRVRSLSLTSNPIVPIILTENANRDGIVNIDSLMSRSFHNKITVLADLYISNYFKHLNYDFLFMDKGFPDRYRVPESGLMYPFLIIFIVAGIYRMIRNGYPILWFFIGWLLISPIGSAFTNDDVPNMQRTLFMLPPVIIFASIGIFSLYYFAKSLLFKGLFFIILIGLCYQATFYFHQYYVHANSYRPWYRQEGYEELVRKINERKTKYEKVVITNRESAPTIFLAFYSAYDPQLLQNYIMRSSLKDTDRISFGDYQITEEECPVKLQKNEVTKITKLVGQKNILYVNSGLCKVDELPQNVEILDSIKREDGSTAFYLLHIK